METSAAVAAASVVIPAHNEAAVIDRCLAALAESELARALEVVVVANGCTDDTVERALVWQSEIPLLRVIDLPAASKAMALNAGDDVAQTFPRLYVDADIEMQPAAVSQLVAALDVDGARVASPRVQFDRAGAGRLVNLFYDSYEQTPYVRRGLVGLGVYAVNRAGRERFGAFPALMADDLLVQLHFAEAERVIVEAGFKVRIPLTILDLVRVRTRIAAGNSDLASSTALASAATAPSSASATAKNLLAEALKRRASLPSVVVYVVVVAVSRAVARRDTDRTWFRDQSTRKMPSKRETSTVAYLVSQYPAPSHTFIEREIRGIEASGVTVHRLSVRSTSTELLLSPEMHEEARRTFVVQATRRVARDVLRLVTRHPLVAAHALLQALTTGATSARSRIWRGFYLAEAVTVMDEMRRRGVRHLHVHFANNGADIARAVVDLGRALDGPGRWSWSFTMHGPTEFENVDHFDLRGKIAHADAVACITDFTRSQLMRLSETNSWSKLTVVPMSVDTDRFVVEPRRRAAGGPLRVLFVGRLVPEKGPLILLEATRLLTASGVDVEVAVVGDGPERSAIERLASTANMPKVRLVGLQGQDEIRRLYGWADALCLPSFQEGLPVVLMEAMATGLPVVTTTIAGIPELVVHGDTGLLVAPGRADLVAAALTSLAVDPNLRARLGSGGRDAVVRNHSTSVAVPAQLNFLKAISPK